jgi:fatty acid desaturase
MTTVRAIEYRIIRDLLRRRERPVPHLADRLIAAVAVIAALLLLGSFLQQLLWVLLPAAVVLTLGTRDG